MSLIDPHGRSIHKLRISVLDACNLRCLYCMPENPKFLAKNQLLSSLEIVSITKQLVQLGIDEIRLTGGEPCLRQDILQIAQEISKLNISKLAMTTNAVHLKPLLYELKKTQCINLNISLDSLQQKTFAKLSGKDQFEIVLENIFLAKELGFHVKINTVLMKGFNDLEIEDFIDFSQKNDIEVRFLELMKIGVGQKYFNSCFMSADETINIIKQKHTMENIAVSLDATAFKYKIDKTGTIGFIASESKPFCNGCSRVRLNAKGEIRPCLMLNEGTSLRNKTQQEVEDIMYQVMKLKPISRIENVNQNMNQIGG